MVNKIMKNVVVFKKSGLSLMELMITVAIMAVLLSTGFTAFGNSIESQKSKQAADQIASAIKQAKYFSRSNGVLTSLFFIEGSNTYTIIADGEIISDNGFYDSFSGILPENTVVVQNTCNEINFYVDGSVVDSEGEVITGSCSIKVGYINGKQNTVTIRGNSGNVIQ